MDERLLELARLVKNLRECQREYFRSRERRDLLVCKRVEQKVDAFVEEILASDRGLFGE